MDDYHFPKPPNFKTRVILTILLAILMSFPLAGKLHWPVFAIFPLLLIIWFFALNAPYEISEGLAAIRLSRRGIYGSRFGREAIGFFLISVVPVLVLFWFFWKLLIR